ncbi:MAG: hypothetical protein IPK19_20605 [Chloroflexi bacterium]|nr:hypothetical protein [Chloroflexota bacterium]
MEDLAFAYQELQRISLPLKILPGDHDIGGAPPQPALRPDVPWLENYLVTKERLARYRSLVGEDHWALTLGDWLLIGLNASLFSSGFDAEAEQWEFLIQQLQAAQGQSIVLLMHKPPCLNAFDETEATTRAVPDPARKRLRELAMVYPIRLFASGHRHIYRTYDSEGVTIVNAPTLMCDADGSWAVDGIYRCGLVEYTFLGHAIDFRMVEPKGMNPIDLPKGACAGWPPLLPGENKTE